MAERGGPSAGPSTAERGAFSSAVSAAAKIGHGVTVGDGAMVGDRCVIDDEVVLGARSTVLADDGADGSTVVKRGAQIGPGAVVHGPLQIGVGAVVRAGAIVVEDVPARAVVAGNPAVVIDYTTADDRSTAPVVVPPSEPFGGVDVAGARLIRLPEFADLRGHLSVAEVGDVLPFAPERIFFTYRAPNEKIRGSHAHRTLHECLIATGGRLTVVVDNGTSRGQVTLDDPTLMLHIPPGLWATQYAFGATTTLVVLASHGYDEADYIRDYDEYLELFGPQR